MGRSIDHLIRSSLRALVVNDFDLGNITGLNRAPSFTQRLTSKTSEPYVYFKSEGSDRIDVTKDNSPRDYFTIIEVRDSYVTGTGGPHISDQIVDEVVEILERNTPVINGVNVYVQTIEGVSKDVLENENKTYFNTTIEVMTRAVGVATNVLPADNPVQLPQFVFDGFLFTPTNNRIELYDAGTITPATTYLNNNNGFDFVDATYSLAPGSDGSLANGVVTIDGDDDASIVSNLNYENENDATDTRTLIATTQFPRGVSFRSGATASSVFTNSDAGDVGISNLPVWNAGRRSIDIGRISPIHQFSVSGATGEHIYFAYDRNQDDLVSIRQHILGGNTDVTAQFTGPTIVGDCKVYVRTQPLIHSGEIIFNLI